MKLPCRHAMVYRKTCGNPFVISFAAIAPRKWLWNLQSTCRDAVLCCAWINNEIKRAVDHPLSSTLIFGELLECWSYTSLRGFGFDLSYSVLFCFRVSAWINDDAMQTFNKKTKALVPVNTQQEIGSSVASFPFVLIPVTLGGVHWGSSAGQL
ncbi:hypothetical protein JG687_00008849 [Phytophthora cactorum]|uniref:Uncharacterized protein n=1 Tax=Phytophthora cactorum TaxID=29920 RepID=A0A8T1UDQ5_9STRA|nr:hypothetical protein JG687_00008849 [Phytophthora cactorum]